MFGSLPLGFLLRVLFLLVCAPSAINAALENSTIDNQDFSKIDYEPSSFWSHGPLLGYYPEFYNGSSSYTWTPGANATFVFTGQQQRYATISSQTKRLQVQESISKDRIRLTRPSEGYSSTGKTWASLLHTRQKHLSLPSFGANGTLNILRTLS